MKRELCSSQIQTKKPNHDKVEVLHCSLWRLLMSETFDFMKT